MYSIDQILEILRAHKPELIQKYPISTIGVFGSFARGEASEQSDIDIAVEITGPMGLNYIEMANEIAALFENKVDIVSKRAIKPYYLPHIEKDIIYV